MAAILNHNAVTVNATATQIIASTTGRTSLLIQNLGTVPIYLGKSTVSASNGIKVLPGESFGDIEFTGAVYGIAESGSCDVRYWEEVA